MFCIIVTVNDSIIERVMMIGDCLKIYNFNGHVDVKISYEINYQCKTNIENTLEISR